MHATRTIAENWRGGHASLQFLFGAPVAFGRVALGAKCGEEARAPIASLFSKFMKTCQFEVLVEGDVPPPGTGCVLCHNETSFADVAAYFVAIWPHVDLLTGADLYGYIPFARRACQKVGIEMVARGKRSATDLLVDRMVAAVENGDRVGWGGEGRLSGMDGVGRFKVGGSLIAIRAKAPVVPVVIHGGHHAMPLGTICAQPGEIRVRFCTPVPTDGYAETDAREFADKLQAIISQNYIEMSKRRYGSAERSSNLVGRS
jgi:1-acyl-sn-glycerol-3-phosphate acyltransferase